MIDRASLSFSLSFPLSIPVASVSSKEDSLIIPIVIAVIVAVVIVIVVLVSIIAIGGYLKGKRKRIPSAETCSEKVQSPEKTVEYSGPPVEERIGDTILQTHLNGTVSRAVQNQPDTNTKTVVELPPPEAVAELPPPNTRISWIEPDSAAFGHWDGVDVQAFNV